MDLQEHIAADPDVLVGKPVIRGTRLSVEFVLGLIAQGWSEADIAQNYRLTADQIRACAAYAKARIGEQKVFARRGSRQLRARPAINRSG